MKTTKSNSGNEFYDGFIPKTLKVEQPKMLKDIGYSEMKELISNLPITQYPALLKHMIECAHAKKVFLPGGLTIFARRLEPVKCGVMGADEDECSLAECPQLRDGEPQRTGRSCPLFK